MNENTLQLISFLKLLSVACFAMLYGMGGIKGKWKRRFIAPTLLIGSICAFSIITDCFSWWYLTYLPALIASLCLGYGSSDLKTKIIKRARFGLCVGISPLALVIINHAWIMGITHLSMCVIVSVLFGVINPTKNARYEETILGFFYGFLPVFMV